MGNFLINCSSFNPPIFDCSRLKLTLTPEAWHLKHYENSGCELNKTGMFVCWLLACLTSQQHAKCISGMDLLKQSYVLLHWYRNWTSNLAVSPCHSSDTRPTSPTPDPRTPGSWQRATTIPILKSLALESRHPPLCLLRQIPSQQAIGVVQTGNWFSTIRNAKQLLTFLQRATITL